MSTLGHNLMEQVRYRVLVSLFHSELAPALAANADMPAGDVGDRLWVHLRERVWRDMHWEFQEEGS